ncbi:Hypothetical protein KVN_LOCUS394 [uncultured virus]|nr:Hypothetical protein KVN_LOCUS394 [uncultured virus]
MDFIIEKHAELLNERKFYSNINKELKLSEKNKKQTEIKSTLINIYDNEPLNENQLIDYGKNLDKEFIDTIGDTPEDFMEYFNKNNINHLYFDQEQMIEQLKFEKYEKIKNRYEILYGSNKKKFRPDFKKNDDASKSPSKNVKDIYFKCLEKIKINKFNVYKIEKKLKHFRNRTASGCGGGTDVYFFFCQKGNFRFELNFIDDCDCDPGLLIIENIVEISSGKNIIGRCDLYCQNTQENITNDVLTLFECDNYNDYLSKRFGHFYNLPKLFTSFGYKFELYNILDYNIHLIDYNLNFYLILETDNIMICPFTMNGNKNYKLLICNPPKRYSEEKFSVNDFKFYNDEVNFIINYDSDNDFENLLTHIKSFANYQIQYEIIKEYFKKKYIKNHKINFSINLDVFATICGMDCNCLELNDKNLKFPLDFYGINLYQDENNFKLTIEGKYVNNIIESYQNNILSNVITLPSLKYEGSFDEMFNQMILFIDKISD